MPHIARSRATRLLFPPFALVALLLAWSAARGARAGWFEYHALEPRHAIVAPPSDAARLRLTSVAFFSRDSTRLRGWYIPSRTGAAIVLAAGSGADRTSMLDDARALSDRGTGVLLFDWPGYGESGGSPRPCAADGAALQGAVDFLAARPDADTSRLGIFGFSKGSYVAVHVAARDARLHVVVLEGVYNDPTVQTRAEYAAGGRAAQWGALLGMRLGGGECDEPRSTEVVATIAPRLVLFVAGTADRTVPLVATRDVFDAARNPKAFWIIPRATHGGYAGADPTYRCRVRALIDSALAATPRAPGALVR